MTAEMAVAQSAAPKQHRSESWHHASAASVENRLPASDDAGRLAVGPAEAGAALAGASVNTAIWYAALNQVMADPLNSAVVGIGLVCMFAGAMIGLCLLIGNRQRQ